MVIASIFNPRLNKGTKFLPVPGNPNMRTQERIFNSEDDHNLDKNMEMFIYQEAQQALSFNKARGSIVSADRRVPHGGNGGGSH